MPLVMRRELANPTQRRFFQLPMIKAAACRFRGEIWTLPRPARHHHILHVMHEVLGWNSETRKVEALADEERIEQGFLDDHGTFYNRRQAAIEAFWRGDIPERKAELFSEDLW